VDSNGIVLETRAVARKSIWRR